MMGWVRAVGAPPAALGGPAGSMGLQSGRLRALAQMSRESSASARRATSPWYRPCRGARAPAGGDSDTRDNGRGHTRAPQRHGTPTTTIVTHVGPSPPATRRRSRPAGRTAPEHGGVTRFSSYGRRAARTRALPSTRRRDSRRSCPGIISLLRWTSSARPGGPSSEEARHGIRGPTRLDAPLVPSPNPHSRKRRQYSGSTVILQRPKRGLRARVVNSARFADSEPVAAARRISHADACLVRRGGLAAAARDGFARRGV